MTDLPSGAPFEVPENWVPDHVIDFMVADALEKAEAVKDHLGGMIDEDVAKPGTEVNIIILAQCLERPWIRLLSAVAKHEYAQYVLSRVFDMLNVQEEYQGMPVDSDHFLWLGKFERNGNLYWAAHREVRQRRKQGGVWVNDLERPAQIAAALGDICKDEELRRVYKSLHPERNHGHYQQLRHIFTAWYIRGKQAIDDDPRSF